MTQDEIIEMARQADVWTEKDFMFADVLNPKIEAFAKLVDAKATAKAVEREREACAKVADEWVKAYQHPSEVIARTIRARAQAERGGAK